MQSINWIANTALTEASVRPEQLNLYLHTSSRIIKQIMHLNQIMLHTWHITQWISSLQNAGRYVLIYCSNKSYEV